MSKFTVFSPSEVASFKHGGKILRSCLNMLEDLVVPGITTLELDAKAEDFIRSHKDAVPAFKGYHNFPGTLCTSVNEQAVHGIPNNIPLKEGDIVSVDCGVIYDEFYTDACITVAVGEVSDDAKHLLNVTKGALQEAVSILKAGIKVGDISSTVQHFVEAQGCSAIRPLTGHGLANTLHAYPDIPNVGQAGTGPELPANIVVAIEPIVTLGNGAIVEEKDGWTISTKDQTLSAHFEHSILITENGYDIIA